MGFLGGLGFRVILGLASRFGRLLIAGHGAAGFSVHLAHEVRSKLAVVA